MHRRESQYNIEYKRELQTCLVLLLVLGAYSSAIVDAIGWLGLMAHDIQMFNAGGNILSDSWEVDVWNALLLTELFHHWSDHRVMCVLNTRE